MKKTSDKNKQTKSAAKKTAKRPLSVPRAQFAKNIAEGQSQTDAYTDAFPGATKESARRSASRLMTSVDIQTAIEGNKQFALQSANVTKDSALGRLAQFAFADFDSLVSADGEIDWKLAKKAGAFKVVKKFKETTKINGDVVKEVELHDPIRAISEIAAFAGWKQKDRENDETIKKVVKAYNTWLEDNPKATADEKSLWLARFASGGGVGKSELAKRVGMGVQDFDEAVH